MVQLRMGIIDKFLILKENGAMGYTKAKNCFQLLEKYTFLLRCVLMSIGTSDFGGLCNGILLRYSATFQISLISSLWGGGLFYNLVPFPVSAYRNSKYDRIHIEVR